MAKILIFILSITCFIHAQKNEQLLQSEIRNGFNIRPKVIDTLFKNRFNIQLINSNAIDLKFFPIVINLSKIYNKYPNFNPLNFVLIDPSQNNEYAIIPVQIDDINDNNILNEMVFVVTIPKTSTKTLYCCYDESGTSHFKFPPKAAASRDWTNRKWAIGWESNWCAYSFFQGRMDFYAKCLEGLQLKNFGTPGFNYHKINDWGADVLIIGDKSGLGGISIWQDDKPVSTISRKIQTLKYDRRILASGPVRALVQVDITNPTCELFDYKISIKMSTFADNRYSKQEVIISAEGLDSVIISPGMQKLEKDEIYIDQKEGFFTSWGIMDKTIGEIGLGLMFPSEHFLGETENNFDRFVKLSIPTNEKITYYTIGAWDKAYNPEPINNIKEWIKQVRNLNMIINSPLKIVL